jgi:type II secretory pathway predicted ATPase ExeA
MENAIDNTNVETSQGSQICEDVKAYIAQTDGMNIGKFAALIKFDRTALSKYLNGKYNANAGGIEVAVKQYFDGLKGSAANKPAAAVGAAAVVGETAAASAEAAAEAVESKRSDVPVKKGTIPQFFMSRDAAGVMGVIQACHTRGTAGIIVGQTGFGKTYVLERFRNNRKNRDKVHYIKCEESMTTRDFIGAIEKVLDLPTDKKGDNARLHNIANFLNANKGHTLFFDEAHKLMDPSNNRRYARKKIENLRDLYDMLKVANESDEDDNSVAAFKRIDAHSTGLVLAGEPALRVNLQHYVPQFENRIKLGYTLRGLCKAEVVKYLEDFNFEDGALEVIAQRGEDTSFRTLWMTLYNVFDAKEDVTGLITRGDIEAARRIMTV